MNGTTKLVNTDEMLKELFSKRRKRLLKGNRYPRLDAKVWSEIEMIEEARIVRGLSLVEYVHEATLRMARGDTTMNEHRKKLRGKKAAGLPGAADQRLKAAFEILKTEKREMKPSALRTTAGCSFRQAREWLDRRATLNALGTD